MHQNDIYEEVLRFFQANLPNACPNVCVAVSGGADSVALFHCLYILKSKIPLNRLAIAHVNHCLRDNESDEDEAFVQRLAENSKVEFFKKKLTKPATGLGFEEWGRLERYTFFSWLRQTQGFDFVATGHTAHDQAETVILRLIRGCGLKGLTGIAPMRDDGIIRPLLGISRDSLRAYSLENKLVFREDSSNKDLHFKRNWVRHEVLHQIAREYPNAIKHVADIARNAQASIDIIKPLINKWHADNVIEDNKDSFFILKSGLTEKALAAEAIAEVFREKKIAFDRKHISELFENRLRNQGIFLLPENWCYKWCAREVQFYRTIEFLKANSESGKTETFSYKIEQEGKVECKGANCVFTLEKFQVDPKKAFTFPTDNWLVFLDADSITFPLFYRSVGSHDVFWPLGSTGNRNVADFLKKQKVSQNGFAGKGAVTTTNNEIIWVPGVRINHAWRITPQTRTILKISCAILR